MQLQTVKQTIGEFEYEITKPLTEQGLEISLTVGKVAVPFMMKFFAAGGDLELTAAAIAQLVMTLTPADIKYLNTQLGPLTQVHTPDGRIVILRPDQLNTHFQDRFDEWATWIVFAIKTVCGSFFAGALGLGALLKKKSPDASASKSPDNSKSPSPVERTG